MNTSVKIESQSELHQQIKNWKSELRKVVFSNGCFDILHLGHIDYLEKARNLGDKLVIGLNSDDSVRKLKGPERPINQSSARAKMLAALAFVDGVTIFEEETPEKLIEFLSPDILVKGSDYSVETILGAKYVLSQGGEVKTIDLVEGYSTTNIIDKIKEK